MRRNAYVALASLGLLLGTAGCDTFLTGDKLSNNPNLPTSASAQQLFIGVQAGQFAFQEGTVAMMMCQWVQACSGGNSRFVQQAAQYVFNESSNIAANSVDWILAYDGGGLIDIKKVEAAVGAVNDSVWLGIAQIWEALTMGTVSSMWGDVPYSEAVAGKTDPVLDDRFVILGNLQTLLTTAIANLGKSGSGPGANDLVLGGNKAAWTKVAWTLKARYYMQTAESLGAAAYTNAIAAATNGISDATGASDLASFHTAATSERNMWTQFQTSSGFGTDLEGGKALIDILKARNDPRLSKYYCRATTTAWKAATKYQKNSAILDPNGNMEQVTAVTADSLSGATQPTWPATAGTSTVDNHVTWINRGLPYVGDDFNTPPPPPVSQFNCLPARFQATARIPYVSYNENELILAEAYNKTGDDVNALLHLNNARATVPLPALVGLTGVTLLDSIMIEKYAAMFQNIESINDYRRTCLPAITPSANSQGFSNVPGRLFYPQTERNVNPNIPTPTVQLATHGFRNEGDVHACQNDNAP
jgi:starch-binding outer membrane protein, SusD/RagB family